MADLALAELDIPGRISRKLEDLEIRSVRQLYARLRQEDHVLRDYLQLSKEDFSELRHKVEHLIREEHPEDLLPKLHPRVHKRGVAIHRLHDPTRPRYNRHSKV